MPQVPWVAFRHLQRCGQAYVNGAEQRQGRGSAERRGTSRETSSPAREYSPRRLDKALGVRPELPGVLEMLAEQRARAGAVTREDGVEELFMLLSECREVL